MSVFNNKKSKEQKFAEATEGMSEEAKRHAEEVLLKPAPIKEYDGPMPKHKSELESRTALIVFKNKAQMDLIGNLFNIRTSVAGETYITDISLLEGIAKQVSNGQFYVSDGTIQLAEGEIEAVRPMNELLTEEEDKAESEYRSSSTEPNKANTPKRRELG